MFTRYKRVLCLAVVVCVAIGSMPSPGSATPMWAPTEGFAAPQIRAIWQHDDGPVASGQVLRTWMWGPGAFYTDYEPYADAPQGNHLVQYFDKGRLEINDPSANASSKWFVTSGLLVKEMVSGQAQTGDHSFYQLGP